MNGHGIIFFEQFVWEIPTYFFIDRECSKAQYKIQPGAKIHWLDGLGWHQWFSCRPYTQWFLSGLDPDKNMCDPAVWQPSSSSPTISSDLTPSNRPFAGPEYQTLSCLRSPLQPGRTLSSSLFSHCKSSTGAFSRHLADDAQWHNLPAAAGNKHHGLHAQVLIGWWGIPNTPNLQLVNNDQLIMFSLWGIRVIGFYFFSYTILTQKSDSTLCSFRSSKRTCSFI
jgi:hypothetical protein